MKLNIVLKSKLLSPFKHPHHSAHSHPYLAHLIPSVSKAVVYYHARIILGLITIVIVW